MGDRARPRSDGVSAAANEILLHGGQIQISGLAAQVGLNLRQFERRFGQQVGVQPKLYARIARFEAALDSKARCRTKSWTEVAHDFGYYDQMHLVHDFESFSGETPTNLLAEVERAHRGRSVGAYTGKSPRSTALIAVASVSRRHSRANTTHADHRVFQYTWIMHIPPS